MVDWPSRRRFQSNVAASSRHLDMVTPFLEFEAAQSARDKVLAELWASFEGQFPPDRAIKQLETLARDIDSSALADPSDLSNAILVSACLEAIVGRPSAEVWEYLAGLAWHSALLEHELPPAVIERASQDASFKDAFLGFAGKVIDKAIASPGRRAFTKEKGLPAQLRTNWLERPQLSTIWWGHSDRHALSVGRDDNGILRIVAGIDLSAFVQLLTRYDYPEPVLAALMFAGGRWSFETWRKLVEIAPPAFESDGRWNGSLILPLLLYFGKEEIRIGLRPDIGQPDVDAATAETDEIAAHIAALIVGRTDGASSAQRWCTWLMRSPLMGNDRDPRPYPADARSAGYAEAALIDAFGKALSLDAWNPMLPGDAEAWEAWCYLGVLVSVGNLHGGRFPPAHDFLQEWELTPEQWCSTPGKELRAHASLFTTFGKRADSYGNRLLAMPLVSEKEPFLAWQQLWASTAVLREIVEFGSSEPEQNQAWQDRNSAAELVRLSFGIGLMMVDALAGSQEVASAGPRSSMRSLFGALTDLAREMTAIDTFDNGYWTDAWRHLAIRCALWSDGKFGRLDPDPEIDFSDYFRPIGQDPEQLLAMLEVATRNEITRPKLVGALTKAEVNLPSLVDLASRILALDSKRARVSETQIALARSLALEQQALF